MAQRAGGYRHRVEVQRAERSRDRFGQPVVTWRTVTKIWVRLVPLAGRERFEAQQAVAETTHRLEAHYSKAARLDARARVKYGDRVFEVLAPPVNVGERNREYHVSVKETVEEPA